VVVELADHGALTTRRHCLHACRQCRAHPFWTLLLLCRLLWRVLWPALFAETVVIAMILHAGW
jgi:hypothetical protein